MPSDAPHGAFGSDSGPLRDLRRHRIRSPNSQVRLSGGAPHAHYAWDRHRRRLLQPFVPVELHCHLLGAAGGGVGGQFRVGANLHLPP